MREPRCRRACTLRVAPNGVWRSLVARPLWERKAVGSNPATPTISRDPVTTSGDPVRNPTGLPGARGTGSSSFGACTACGYYANCAPVCLHCYVSQGPRIR